MLLSQTQNTVTKSSASMGSAGCPKSGIGFGNGIHPRGGIWGSVDGSGLGRTCH